MENEISKSETTTVEVEYIPISELIRKNSHWFSEDNKGFFKSKWDSYALHNKGSIYAYFVSSEKHESLFSNINEPRKYTIRKFNLRDGDLKSESDIFDFQKYGTKSKALRALKEYMKTEPIKNDTVEYINSKIESLRYNIKRIESLTTELLTVTGHLLKSL